MDSLCDIFLLLLPFQVQLKARPASAAKCDLRAPIPRLGTQPGLLGPARGVPAEAGDAPAPGH